MHIDWFSCLFSAIVIFFFPMMVTIVCSDTYRGMTRHQRLDAWQVTTLASTTMLAAYTYFFVRAGRVWFIDGPTLWTFCAAGIALSIILQVSKLHIANKQRLLQRQLARVVYQR